MSVRFQDFSEETQIRRLPITNMVLLVRTRKKTVDPSWLSTQRFRFADTSFPYRHVKQLFIYIFFSTVSYRFQTGFVENRDTLWRIKRRIRPAFAEIAYTQLLKNGRCITRPPRRLCRRRIDESNSGPRPLVRRRLVNVNPKTINYAITRRVIPRIALRWRSTLYPWCPYI